jgi:hypothetical protein
MIISDLSHLELVDTTLSVENLSGGLILLPLDLCTIQLLDFVHPVTFSVSPSSLSATAVASGQGNQTSVSVMVTSTQGSQSSVSSSISVST